LLWASNQTSSVYPMAGLESFFPGETALELQENCVEDYRYQPWRWLAYQFTHVGFSHIGMNCLMLIIMGAPLEGFNGTALTLLMFNIGVFGGACCWMVADNHTTTVGMSGGCYSMIGIMLGSLIMNWAENKYARTSLLMTLLIPAVDLVQAYFSSDENVSNAAHFGGTVAGLLASVVFGRNMDVTETEKKLSMAALFTGLALAAFCLGFALYDPVPMDIFEQVRFCWWRQIINPSLFGDSLPHCVRCSETSCISLWEASMANATCADGACIMGTVSFADCAGFGGWSDIKPVASLS